MAGKTVGRSPSGSTTATSTAGTPTEDLFELYVPLWSPGRNAPAVVLEVYRPWSLYAPLIHAGIVRTGIVAAVLTLLYCMLLGCSTPGIAVAGRPDTCDGRVIRRQPGAGKPGPSAPVA